MISKARGRASRCAARMEQVRLFWAVSLPEEIKRKLAGIQSLLRVVPADVKWVEQQNLHLTVKFMGNVNVDDVSTIIKAVRDAVRGAGAFTLRLGGTGFFPGTKKPRVLWVGVNGEVDKLIHLHEMVETSLSAVGFAPGEGRFTPHLTLGRIRTLKGVGQLVEAISKLDEETRNLGKVDVTTLELIQSKLTRKGPVYSVITSLDLQSR